MKDALFRPLRFLRRRWKLVAGVVAFTFVLVNVLAARLAGSIDTRATPNQVRAVFDRLKGPKQIQIFVGVGHEPFRARDVQAWDGEARSFLAGNLP